MNTSQFLAKKEVLQDPNNNRLTVFPLKFKKIWDAYENQKASFWTAQEIDFSKDYEDFKKLNEGEQHFVKMVLAFFAASDGIVNLNLGERFMKDVEVLEAKVAYRFQSTMEDIHAETYSLMIESIIKNNDEKHKLFDAISNFSCIAKNCSAAFEYSLAGLAGPLQRVWVISRGCLHSGALKRPFGPPRAWGTLLLGDQLLQGLTTCHSTGTC